MENDKGAVTGFFISHWGVPSDIRMRSLRGIGEVAILEFAPKGERTTWRYATNGMSARLQRDGDGSGNVRTEIYGCATSKTAWIDDLLAAVAMYPFDRDTYLAEGDTIDAGGPVDRNRSSFTALLLARPGLCDAETLGLVAGIPGDVLVHQIIGVLPAESEFAERHGGKSLWEKMEAGDTMLDRDRPPVV